MIVSFLNQKGGVGKTTLAINIAYYFKLRADTVALIDTDPQGSARNWHEKSNGQKLDVFGLDRPTLPTDLKNLDLRRDWIFMDGVPQLSIMAAKAIACSDIVIIPVTPSPYDVWSTATTVELIKTRQSITNGYPKAALLISRKISNTNIGKDVIDALAQFELPIFKNSTTQRVVYPESAMEGKTVFDFGQNEAVIEVANICTELMEFSNHEKN